MFNLEQAILEWRRQMLAAGIKTPVPLAELENHLREEVDHQMRGGFSAQTAFKTAASQIGHAHDLRVEFEKISTAGSPHRYLWLFCLLSAPLLVLVNIWALKSGEISPAAHFAGLAIMSLAALYISGLPFLYRRLPNPRNRLVQIAMWMGCFLALVWPLLATFIAIGIVHLHVGIAVEMIIWTVGAAWFATWLAYWVSGRGDRRESIFRSRVCS